jgi:hypothetical protein
MSRTIEDRLAALEAIVAVIAAAVAGRGAAGNVDVQATMIDGRAGERRQERTAPAPTGIDEQTVIINRSPSQAARGAR